MSLADVQYHLYKHLIKQKISIVHISRLYEKGLYFTTNIINFEKLPLTKSN